MIEVKGSAVSTAGRAASRRMSSATSLLILPALVLVGFFLVLPYLNMLYISVMTP